MLEDHKMATNHLLVLNRRIDELEGRLNMYESPWAQKTGEMAYMNQEARMIQWPINYNTDYSYPNANRYSVDISYTPMNDYWGQN
jgi:hypothetical protein